MIANLPADFDENLHGKIPLHDKNGEITGYALVDLEDIERLSKISWYITFYGYVQGTIKKKLFFMHRYILDAVKGDPMIDHKNNYKLDNRKRNLHFVNASQNAQNRTLSTGNKTSQYRGVSFSKQRNKWVAQGGINSKRKGLGYFNSEQAAAFAYDQYVLKEFGLGAAINNVQKPEDFLQYKKKSKPRYVKIDGIEQRCFTIQKNKNGIDVYHINLKHKLCPSFVKGLRSLEKAKVYYLECLEKIEKAKAAEKVRLSNIPIVRNEEGVAILKCKNGKGEKNKYVSVAVDDDIYRLYESEYCRLSGFGYPVIVIDGKKDFLHRLVVNAQPGTLIDHINRDKLNAQRSNLRHATSSENAHNKNQHINSSGMCTGVRKRGNSYSVSVVKDSISHPGGSYNDANVANWARDQLAKQLFGNHASLNHTILEGYEWTGTKAIQKEKSTIEVKKRPFENNLLHKTHPIKMAKI